MPDLLTALLNKFQKGKFGFDLLSVISGRALSIVIGILFTPILTRIYTPENYGEFNLYLSWVGILQVISTLGYVNAIVPAHKYTAQRIAVLSLAIVLIISSISLISGFLVQSYFQEMAWYNIAAVSFGVFFASMAEIFSSLNVRRREFKLTSLTEISRNLAVRIMAVLMGLFPYFGSLGLILSDLMGKMAVGVFYLIINLKNPLRLLKWFKLIDSHRILRKYSSFPKFVLPSALLGRISNFGMPIFIGNFFTKSTLGYYSLSMGLLNIPLQIFGSSISSVYFQKSADLYRSGLGEVALMSRKLITMVLGVSLVPFAFLIVFGDWLFGFIFGDRWIMSGVVTQILSFSFPSMLIYYSVSNLFIVIEKQKTKLLIDIALLILLASVSIISVYFTNFILLVSLISLVYLIIYNISILYLLKVIKSGVKVYLLLQFILFPIIIGGLFFLRKILSV